MLGAVVGDIVGSRFEWHNCRSKQFDLFAKACFATDDSIMTLAVAQAIVDCQGDYEHLGARCVLRMREIGQPYPTCGYGGRFLQWMYAKDPQPYGSFGNGAPMRVSPCGEAARSLEEAKELSRKVTEITHDHPEGIKGAEAAAVAVYLAKAGTPLAEIRAHIEEHYYPMDFTLDEIRPTYRFDESSQGTVPQALMAFFESTDFEDAIRNAISIGGDSDTVAAITGGVAGAYYGVPAPIRAKARRYLDERLRPISDDWERFMVQN